MALKIALPVSRTFPPLKIGLEYKMIPFGAILAYFQGQTVTEVT